MSKKTMPAGDFTLNSRFDSKVRSFHTKWNTTKPNIFEARIIAHIALSSDLDPNVDYFEADQTSFPKGNVLSAWFLIFMEHPDFTLALMTKLRKEMSKFDLLDRVLWEMSYMGKLSSISDGDLLLEVRRRGVKASEVSQDKIEKRRQRWTAGLNAFTGVVDEIE
jgi:hypothetical protein